MFQPHIASGYLKKKSEFKSSNLDKGRSLQLSLTLPFAFFDGIPETLKHTDPAHFAEIKNTTVPKY